MSEQKTMFEKVEEKARELCEIAGLDPDGLSYGDVVWPVPLWHAYIPLAREILMAALKDNVVSRKEHPTESD